MTVPPIRPSSRALSVPRLVLALAAAAAVTLPSITSGSPALRAVASGPQPVAAVNTVDNNSPDQPVSEAASYASGDRFSVVDTSGGLRYDADLAGPGGASLLVSAGSQSGRAVVGWNERTLGSRTALFASVLVRLSALPGQRLSVLSFDDTDGSEALVQVTARGRLRVTDRGGGVLASDLGAVPTDRWFRLEADAVAGPNGGLAVRLYDGAATGTPDEELRVAASLGSQLTGVRFGSTTDRQHLPRFWVDVPQVRSDRQPGAYVAPPSPFTISEGFESGTLGLFNQVENVTTSTTAPLAGSTSATFDARRSASTAEMSQAVHGTDKRYARVSFSYRYDGPAGFAVNQPVVTVRNTSDILFGGGGHLNLWGDINTGTIRGDLQAGDGFDSGVAFVPGRTYDVAISVSFQADGTSRAGVRIDGAQVGSFSSTTPAGDRFRGVVLGSLRDNPDFRATYDDVSVTTSSTPLG